MEIISQTSTGETEEPKEEKTKSEKTKDEKAKKEKTKDKKGSSKSSKTKTEKGEEKDIYFIIKYKLNRKEPDNLNFSDECESIPKIILNKEIPTNNNKYAYKKVFKYKEMCLEGKPFKPYVICESYTKKWKEENIMKMVNYFLKVNF